ncbi:hypothetical protein LPJ78_004615 [Coemansia sp. RSA 989]|nr:hypothetical protein LPJ68_002943 [Coemansia sp. RSA 1086]KAJ1862597.1 hypothetical protein LPJ78_004615 [Coemansia sp. RSA 989]KAJ1871551.1 hypothetical protein LPJ55_003793 [Coemansia sp. RSA 990]KAJ2646903.1 hypothetical protein IWW40_005076 [Coemansia sp. RSA 1250]KAJ2668741.1 hypothetical protein IWW42_005010 [Coemansia sp. RSA 1085]
MGQSGSKAARNLRLPRTAPKQPPSGKITTREQMLQEETAEESAKLHDNLKYFLNPKELKTPITPLDPRENANVQALRNREPDDDMGLGRANSKDIAAMIRQLRQVEARQRGQVAAKYGMDAETAQLLERFLDPVV